jgi:cell division protein ZapD
VREGISIVLRLLRESGKVSNQIAPRGVYQQMMAGRMSQMLRLRLRSDYDCVPEISANKYALNIRFVVQEEAQRPKVVESDIEFELTFCNL